MNFIEFARAHGVEIDPARFYSSDKIHRCGTVEKPRSNNGAWFWDGQRGWVMDWSGDARTVWFQDPNAKPWTPEEKHTWMLKRQIAKTKHDQAYDLAALRADVVLRSAKMDTHAYLTIKGFPEDKGLVLDHKLLIPMRNVVTNKLQGYQEIWWDVANMKYEKKMLAGMRARNAVLYMGDRAALFKILVEGYATALSVKAALKIVGLNASVICCFSASNLVQISSSLSGKVGIYADNDQSQTGEKSAIQTGFPYVMSEVVGHDANDDMKKFGTLYVAQKLMELNQKCRLQT